ncbi:carboxypeptidase-like regulatory domain-containing protein [Mucilaginibacter ximonensis]|uniref:Carboxypeptidase-like regulatory domain-containing protein n=1 Tax=Mucilaginibacter ximonensis TaxID=538021 RepID=A0ABW5YAD0_9SPHI
MHKISIVLLRNCLLIILLTTNIDLLAQSRYKLSGTVNDEHGKPLNGATVFLSGSKTATISNEFGKFEFPDISAGTFQLIVKMLGYSPYQQSIIISDKPLDIQLSLSPQSIKLKEVTIGKRAAWQKEYAIFKEQFLGDSTANECVILNPEVINFSTKKTLWNRIILNADADEFLEIENKRLGYRIKYLLKTFTYNGFTKITSYDGNTVFEEMNGTEEEKKLWNINRLSAYKGSFMHFLRSVYMGSTLAEGFITRQLYVPKNAPGNFSSYIAPIKFDTILTRIDSSLISMKFTSLYVVYDPKAVADMNSSMLKGINSMQKISNLSDTGSILSLYLDRAIIDQKGSFADYRTFLIRGFWGRKRVGDQLPYEYQPPSF